MRGSTVPKSHSSFLARVEITYYGSYYCAGKMSCLCHKMLGLVKEYIVTLYILWFGSKYGLSLRTVKAVL